MKSSAAEVPRGHSKDRARWLAPGADNWRPARIQIPKLPAMLSTGGSVDELTARARERLAFIAPFLLTFGEEGFDVGLDVSAVDDANVGGRDAAAFVNEIGDG